MTTVLICDDDPIVREALGAYLEHEQDLEVVAMVETAEEALAQIETTRPEVVLMDLVLPGMDGIEATRLARGMQPAPAVLVLTTFGTDDHVRAALASGATGFLLKATSAPTLVAAVHAAAARAGTVITPELASRIAVDPAARSDREARAAGAAREALDLTGRETEVLTLLCAAESNAGIADALSLSESTVKTHVSSLMTKLGCSSRLEIALRAFERGLAAPPQPTIPPAPPE